MLSYSICMLAESFDFGIGEIVLIEVCDVLKEFQSFLCITLVQVL